MNSSCTIQNSSRTSSAPRPLSQNFSCPKKIFFALATIAAIGGIVALVIGNLGISPAPYDFVAIVGGTASLGIGCGVIVALMLKKIYGRQHILTPNQPATILGTDPNSSYYGWRILHSEVDEYEPASQGPISPPNPTRLATSNPPPPVRREDPVNPNDCSNGVEMARRLAEQEGNQHAIFNRLQTSDEQNASPPYIPQPQPQPIQVNSGSDVNPNDCSNDSDENREYMIPLFNQRNWNPSPPSGRGDPATTDFSNDEELARRLAEGDQEEIYAHSGRDNVSSAQNNPTPEATSSPQGLPLQNDVDLDVDLNDQIPPSPQEDGKNHILLIPQSTIDAQSYLRSQYSSRLKIKVNRQHMRQDPQDHLDKFYNLLKTNGLVCKIDVTFIRNNGVEEQGLDLGGLRMVYINNLFSHVLENRISSRISASSGSFYPQVIMSQDKTNLEKLGYIMGYCGRHDYRIGAQFDFSLFAALLFGFNADDLNTPYDQLNDQRKQQALKYFFSSRKERTVSRESFEYEEARLWEIAGKSSEQIEVTDLKFIFKYALKNSIDVTELKDPEDMSEEAKQSATIQREQFKSKLNHFFLSQHGDIVNENIDEHVFGYASQAVALKDEVLLTDEQFINKLISSGTVKIEDKSLKTYKLLKDEPIGRVLTKEELLKKYRILSEDQYSSLLLDFPDVIKDFKDDVCQQIFDPYAAALHALANGYKSALGTPFSNDDQEWASLQARYNCADRVAAYTDFEKAIQGSIDKEFIASSIECEASDENVQKKTIWLQNWIRSKASPKQIKEFLVFATGSSSLSIPIMITEQIQLSDRLTADKEGYTPFPISHTCTSHLEIAPGVAGSQESFNDETEENFCYCIETAIRGACEDGGEFNSE